MLATLIRVLAFAVIPVNSDAVCFEATDMPACIEAVCRIASNVDFADAECDGLADHVRYLANGGEDTCGRY